MLGPSGDLERHSAYMIQGSSSFMCSHKEFSDLRAKESDDVLAPIMLLLNK